MASLQSFDLSPGAWVIAAICAIMIGMSKTGVSGLSILYIPLLAALFGGRLSTGILLPMLITADMFAIIYYRRHAEWKYVFRVLPWALAGIAVGLLVGRSISDGLFRKLIGVLVLLSLAVGIWSDRSKGEKIIPHKWWFAASFGLLGGFSTMIGNAAGPLMAVYLLAMGLPKQSFVGTAAWFFAIVNLIKLPLQVWGWNNINADGLCLNAALLPAIALGAFLGVMFLKHIPERYFKIFILITTLAGALYLLMKQ